MKTTILNIPSQMLPPRMLTVNSNKKKKNNKIIVEVAYFRSFKKCLSTGFNTFVFLVFDLLSPTI